MVKAKILYILRHAKAEAGTSYQDDHERPLMERGIEAAENMGKYFVRHSIMPDRVLCSTAERASATWEHVREAYKIVPQLEYSEKAYLASCNELFLLLAQTREEVGSLMLVGHNPGLHQLCLKLARDGDEKLIDTMMLKFPTCAFAEVDLGKVAWADIASAHGTLTHFTTPGILAGT